MVKTQKSMSVASGSIGPNYIAPILTGSRDWDFANPESRDWKINSGIAIPNLGRRWSDLDEIWYADADSHANDDKRQLETGSKNSIWRPFVSQTWNSNILAADWATLSKFRVRLYCDVLNCDTSPKRKPEVDLRRYSRHHDHREDVITRPPTVRFG